MTKKIRYAILAFGFVVFMLLAPIIVLYVRGIVYSFKTHSFVNTGILAIRTDPKTANIYLDGKLKSKSSGDIKFLLPGEYQVTFKKPGYNDWSKRLVVLPGKVTWASPYLNKTYLLLSNPGTQTINNDVLDFYNQNGQITYLTSDKLFTTAVSDMNQKQNYPLPKPVDKILAVDNNNKIFILTDEASSSTKKTVLAFNADSGKFIDLSGLFKNLASVQFSGNSQLYALDDNTLYIVNPETNSKTTTASDIKTFYFQNNDLYAIQENTTNDELWVSQAPYTQTQTLISNLPGFSSGKLFVTFEKQILLLGDNNLYLANSSMQKLADGVDKINFDQKNSVFSVLHYGELDYYGSLNQNLNFVTRSSEQLNNLDIKTEIGYAFFSRGSEVDAIELDTHDRQNQYALYSGKNLQKFAVDETDYNIILLDDGALKILKLR